MSRILACVLAGGAIAAGGWMHSANAMPNIPLAGAEPTALVQKVWTPCLCVAPLVASARRALRPSGEL